MHYFDGGNCIGRFQLATNEVYINKTTNEKITSTEWHNLVVRNKAAEICENICQKGIKYMLRVLNRANGRPRMGPQNILVKFK
jgi:single-stranded DNA-binding protein